MLAGQRAPGLDTPPRPNGRELERELQEDEGGSKVHFHVGVMRALGSHVGPVLIVLRKPPVEMGTPMCLPNELIQ